LFGPQILTNWLFSSNSTSIAAVPPRAVPLGPVRE